MNYLQHGANLSITNISFFLLLTTGLLTGLSHCAGMCGPLVGAFVLQQRTTRSAIATPLTLFQLGRLATYTLLGVVWGAIGSLLSLATIWQGWQGLLSVVLGGMLVVFGLSLLDWLPWRRYLEANRFAITISRALKKWATARHPLAPFGLGVLNGLLPCGPVYALSLVAAASESPWRGGAIMFIFGLGTLPTLIGVGFSMGWLSLEVRRHLFRVAASLVILVGLQLTLRGLAVSQLIPHWGWGGVMLW